MYTHVVHDFARDVHKDATSCLPIVVAGLQTPRTRHLHACRLGQQQPSRSAEARAAFVHLNMAMDEAHVTM